MNQYQYYENYYTPTTTYSSEEYLQQNFYNNSTSPQHNNSYYNNYWYSRSDCSSSSIDTSASTSPITRPINSYDCIGYYFNSYEKSNGSITPVIASNTNKNVSNNQNKNTNCNKNLIENMTSTVHDDKFSKEILPLLNAISSGECSSSSKRRMRTAFTSDQRKYLLKVFEKQMYPGKEQLEELSKKLSVTPTIIQTWFKNMRAKKKKVAKFVVNDNDDC